MRRLNPQVRSMANICFDPTILPGSIANLPMAGTFSSDTLNALYPPALIAWTAAQIGPPPNVNAFVLPRPDRPNTMDLCTWYLKQQRLAGYPRVNLTIIAKVQKPEFIAGLRAGDKPIDTLKETLGGKFLHEVRFAFF